MGCDKQDDSCNHVERNIGDFGRCQCYEVGYQWCRIHNDDSQQHVVVLRLESHQCKSIQVHPDKESIQQTDTDTVIAALADKVYDTCQCTNRQQSQHYQHACVQPIVKDGELDVSQRLKMLYERREI